MLRPAHGLSSTHQPASTNIPCHLAAFSTRWVDGRHEEWGFPWPPMLSMNKGSWDTVGGGERKQLRELPFAQGGVGRLGRGSAIGLDESERCRFVGDVIG